MRASLSGDWTTVDACLATVEALAANSETPAPAFHLAFGRLGHHYARRDAARLEAVAPAVEGFGALLRAEPGNPVLMAYAGAATAMQARTTWLPWKKMSYAEDGLALLDKSLALLGPAHDAVIQNGTPGALEVRFVAANTFLAVPGFMNRAARGAKLLADVLASPLFAQAPLGFQGSVWMRAAALAAQEQRNADARRYLAEVVQHNAPQADAARAQLKGLPS
jgi:hypothetical protein